MIPYESELYVLKEFGLLHIFDGFTFGAGTSKPWHFGFADPDSPRLSSMLEGREEEVVAAALARTMMATTPPRARRSVSAQTPEQAAAAAGGGVRSPAVAVRRSPLPARAGIARP